MIASATAVCRSIVFLTGGHNRHLVNMSAFIAPGSGTGTSFLRQYTFSTPISSPVHCKQTSRWSGYRRVVLNMSDERAPSNTESSKRTTEEALLSDNVHTPSPAATEASAFRKRFEHLRGADIEPVSAAMERFSNSFHRPIPIVYRAVINEAITTTHLAVVCAMWRFDAIFAYGFDSIFSNFLRYYPSADERDNLYNAVATSLKFDPSLLSNTAADVANWIDGKTENDILSALAEAPAGADVSTVGPVIEALAYIRDADEGDWYYSKLFGVGLIQIMSAVGADLSNATADKWADAIGLERSKLGAELGSYLSGIERLKQAEQIFAEATAREAKKTAERLAEKARKAAEEADKLEQDEDPPTVAPGSREVPPA